MKKILNPLEIYSEATETIDRICRAVKCGKEQNLKNCEKCLLYKFSKDFLFYFERGWINYPSQKLKNLREKEREIIRMIKRRIKEEKK